MNSQEKSKRFKRAIGRHMLLFVTWIFQNISHGAMKGIARFFVGLSSLFVARQKKISKESIKIAFGDSKSDKELDEIIKRCFDNLSRGMIELIFYMGHPEWIKKKTSFEGKKNLDEALSQGNGVVLVSAHFGNFPLMLIRLAQEKYKMNAIIRPVRDQELEKHFSQQRRDLGVNTIYAQPRKQCVDTSIRALRDNQLLFIPLDQHFGSGGGVFVDFFGQKAATATGPVVFARRTKSPILPVFIARQKDDTHKIIIDKPIKVEEKKTDEETVQHNVQRITNVIEKYIRRYPEEWSWMHRRWKSKSKH